ncbi:ABC transporter permease [Roseovarius sp. HI0049]|nr:ABC transporter permease [Roseovarius sp. HI0049]KZY42112.1 ABC transporter permease [Roseovarius sp. HI0049]
MTERLTLYAMRLGAIAFLLAIWEGITRTGMADPNFVGQPSKIYSDLVEGLITEGHIWPELGFTLYTTLLSFVIGAGAAIIFGLLFVLFPKAEKVLEPILAAFNAMPRTALAPLLIVWFGLGIWSKVAIGASLCFFIVLQNTVAGIRGVNADHVTLARTLGLSRSELFWKITMPGAVPVMFAGLRLGLVVALLGVVAGEIIASRHGVGQQISYLAAAFDMSGVWALLFVLAFAGMILAWLLDVIEARLNRWH